MTELSTWLIFSGVVLLAAAIQALTGFGFGLVALAVLGVVMDLREAVLMIAPAGLALNIMLFLRLRREFSWEGLVPLVLACLVGVPIGAWLLLSMDLAMLKLTIAVVMITTALHRVWLQSRSSTSLWHPVKAGVPCGLVSGVLAGAFGAGGPPVVSYLMNRPINRFRYVASMQMVAGICSCLRLAQFTHAGRYEARHWLAVVPSVLAVFLGIQLGARLLRAVSDAAVRNVIIGFLLVGGIYYICQVWS